MLQGLGKDDAGQARQGHIGFGEGLGAGCNHFRFDAPLPCTPLATTLPIPSHISPLHLQASPGVEFRFHYSSASVCAFGRDTCLNTLPQVS